MREPRCRTEHGFTLIELVVVVAILGILLALAIPRYAASGRNAVLPEADNILNELRSLSWAYYQQYGDWTGVTTATFQTTFGFSAPASTCWTFAANNAGATSIDLVASGNPFGGPARCGALGPAGSATVTLTVRGNGSSTRVQVLP